MPAVKDPIVQSSLDVLRVLGGSWPPREGGDLRFNEIPNYLSETEPQSLNSFITARTIPTDNKPFVISIFDTEQSADMVSLTMMVNPKDLNIGQSIVVESAYSRLGWINTLWGNNQPTLSASGLTSGFYYVTAQGGGGLTNFYRKNSVGYLNVLALISLFKNNGNYYMDPVENPTLFKDGRSRVINVMDTIRVSYDGSDYLGSFSSFSLTDVATNPYRMEYSFEFIVSAFNNGPVEGHVKTVDNYYSDKVIIAIQGMNTGFNTSVKLNSDELNRYFPPDPPIARYQGENYAVPRTGVVDTDAKAQIKIDEGERLEVYMDTLGNLTVGVGHKVLPGDKLKLGDTITQEQSDALFAKDYAAHAAVAQQVVPGFNKMPANVQADLINMAYNMGGPHLSKFEGTFACLNNKNYYGAALNLRNTTWYSQVYPRSERIIQDILNTGKTTVADATKPGQ